MKASERTPGLSIVGVAVAACVACCVAPFVAVLGTVGLAGLVSTAFVGVAGLVLAASAIAAIVIVRRRRPKCPTGATC